MKSYCIVDRGDGPKIEGTRITVYTIFEYLKKGRSREWIAAMLGLSSRQVQVAMNYIGQHQSNVEVEYAKIAERIQRGHPPWVEERLKSAHEKFQRRLARHGQEPEAVEHAEDHGGQ